MQPSSHQNSLTLCYGITAARIISPQVKKPKKHCGSLRSRHLRRMEQWRRCCSPRQWYFRRSNPASKYLRTGTQHNAKSESFQIIMFLYPFKTQFLHTEMDRLRVSEALIGETFLSDANYRKTDSNPRVFFGEISTQDFTIERIENKNRLIQFCTGEIRGSENEIYILLQLGAWQHRRIFLLFLILIMACLGMLVNHLIIYKALYPQNLAAWLLLATIFGLFTLLYSKAKTFKKQSNSTLEYFCNLWKAKTIDPKNVPLVFR